MKKVLICAFALGCSVSLLAQQKDSSATDKVDVFSSHYYRGSAEKTGDKERFIVKINPLLFFNGQLPVYMETRIGGDFTAEGAVGVTFKDHIGPALNYDVFDGLHDYESDLNTKNTTARPGILLKGAVRYYFGVEDFPEGFFLGAQVQYSTYNLDFNIPDMGNLNLTQSGKIPLALSFTDEAIISGYQIEIFEHTYMEFYYGLGARQEHIEYVSEMSNNYTPANYFVKNGVDYNTLVYLLGLKVGYSF